MHSEQWRRVEEYAKSQMDKLGLHGWPHVKRVEHLCGAISKLEAGNSHVDLDALRAAALLHDVAKYREKKGDTEDHGEVGAVMAQDFLKTVGFEEDEIRRICHAIRFHTHREEPAFVEARILHDADFLDKLGAVGIATLFIKACLTDKTIEEVSEIYATETSHPSYAGLHVRWLKKQDFYTTTAKKIAERRNKVVSEFFSALRSELDLDDFRLR